jgi:ribosome-associated toxin RatA of RatAB toxin-antitoxin module
MASAKTTEIFNYSAQQIFDVIKDFENYAKFLPEVKSSKVIEDLSETKKIVELSVSMIKDFTYSIIATLDEPKSLTWVFNAGDIFKSNTGSWTLKAISPTQTQVTYEVGAEFKLFVPSMISKKLM